MRSFLVFLLVIAGILLLIQLSENRAASVISEKRDDFARNSKGDVMVAVVWENPNLYQGAQMAADEINGSGGVLGRKIVPVSFQVPTKDQVKLAHRIAGNVKYCFVIGHSGSASAIPASVAYAAHGVVFFAVDATVPELTNHGFTSVFRNTPGDDEYAKVLLKYCADQNKKKVVILGLRTHFSEDFSNAFVASSEEAGVQVVLQKSFMSGQEDFREAIAEVQKTEFDLILLLAWPPEATRVISQIREMGAKQPIFGADSMDTPLLWQSSGKAAEGIVVAGIFSAKSDNPGVQEFVRDFRKRYNTTPYSASAQGYEAMNILAQAIRRVGSMAPIDVSSALRFTGSFQGLDGSISYSPQGDIQGKNIYMKVVRNNGFDLEATIER